MITSVYQKLLGDEFTKLAPKLQLSHGSMAEVKATGTIDVEYGKNLFVTFLNKISKMPPKGKGQKMVLTIHRFQNKETWKRNFNGQIFSTDQWVKKELMYERSGLMTLTFNLSVKDSGLYFEQKQTKFAGILMPAWMGVHTTAVSIEESDGWRVNVEVNSPLLGLMLKYTGIVQIQR